MGGRREGNVCEGGGRGMCVREREGNVCEG